MRDGPQTQVEARQCHQAMAILFCANPPYFQPLATAAVSVAQHNRLFPLHIHVVTCDRDDHAEQMLRDSLSAYDQVALILHHVDGTRLEYFFVDGFLTKECYLRLLAPDVLPEHIARVVYLDADVVAVDDLAPLACIDLGDALVAAAPDYPNLAYMTSAARLAAIGIPSDTPYVNSGVLVMDLAGWRRDNVAAQMLDYVRRMGKALSFHDQDAINAVLSGRIRLLDPRWNLQARMYRCGRGSFPEALAATVEARRHPAIIHYTGSEKPWLFRSRTARKGDYVRYQRLTAWGAAEPAGLSALQRTEFRLDRVLSRLGIDYLHVLFKLGRVPQRLAGIVGSLRQHLRGATTP